MTGRILALTYVERLRAVLAATVPTPTDEACRRIGDLRARLGGGGA